VYFDTSKFSKYGRLGNIQIQKLQEGARVEINKEKIWNLKTNIGTYKN
jgi:cysteinyl-tRNA synthetase